MSHLSFSLVLSKLQRIEGLGVTYQSRAIARVFAELAMGHWRTPWRRIYRRRRSCDRSKPADRARDFRRPHHADRQVETSTSPMHRTRARARVQRYPSAVRFNGAA